MLRQALGRCRLWWRHQSSHPVGRPTLYLPPWDMCSGTCGDVGSILAATVTWKTSLKRKVEVAWTWKRAWAVAHVADWGSLSRDCLRPHVAPSEVAWLQRIWPPKQSTS